MDLYARAEEAAQFIRDQGGIELSVAVVLGSGMGSVGQILKGGQSIPYERIPHFPKTSVAGHTGQVVVGSVGPVKTIMLQGRVHYYEGIPMDVVTFPIRVLKILRVGALILTCAGGGLDPRFRAAKLMLIQDHINLMGVNPLRGAHDERFGSRFPDMSRAYDHKVLAALQTAGTTARVNIRKGVYAALPGPSYETPAEIKMLQKLGVDAVGMSTVPEVIVANQMEMKVGGLCSITNLAAGMGADRLSHDDVQQEAAGMMEDLKKFFNVAIPLVAQVGR